MIAIVVVTSTQLAAQSTIESIPNQKLINGSYVSDPDDILSESTISQIDSLLTSLEKETTVQIAVVVVKSIGDEDIFDFAQNLFNNWGVGNKENNNGLLLLLAKDQHTVRFHTGDGLEATLPDVICKRIQRDYMVPEFKNDNYDAGILAGLQEVTRILTDPIYAQELLKPEEEADPWLGLIVFLAIFISPVLLIAYYVKASNGRFTDSKKKEKTPYPEMRLKRWGWLWLFVGIPAVIVTLFSFDPSENKVVFCIFALYFYYMLTLFHRLWRVKKVINRFVAIQDYYEIVEFLRKQQWYWFFMALLFPIPFAPYFFYHLARKRIYRNHPRNCKQCESSMQKLNDVSEDEFLSDSQKMEEKLKSVDYDVWKCESCASIEQWFYLNNSSKYDTCPKCKTIAWYSSSRRTVVSATYSSSGSGEEIHTCKFCSHKKTSSYTIAKLVASTSSSSSSGSSRSSSGGSWGGGSSSGGGASSSW